MGCVFSRGRLHGSFVLGVLCPVLVTWAVHVGRLRLFPSPLGGVVLRVLVGVPSRVVERGGLSAHGVS